VSIPKSIGDVLPHPGWHHAMIDEISVLQNSETWQLAMLSYGKFVVSCMWTFAIKVGPDDTIDHLKSCLVAKGYTQFFGLVPSLKC